MYICENTSVPVAGRREGGGRGGEREERRESVASMIIREGGREQGRKGVYMSVWEARSYM